MTSVVSPRTVPGWNPAPKSVPLNANLGVSSPLAVASQMTRWGGDGGWARITETSANAVTLAIDEDVNCDTERSHTTEQVGIVAFSQTYQKNRPR